MRTFLKPEDKSGTRLVRIVNANFRVLKVRISETRRLDDNRIKAIGRLAKRGIAFGGNERAADQHADDKDGKESTWRGFVAAMREPLMLSAEGTARIVHGLGQRIREIRSEPLVALDVSQLWLEPALCNFGHCIPRHSAEQKILVQTFVFVV